MLVYEEPEDGLDLRKQELKKQVEEFFFEQASSSQEESRCEENQQDAEAMSLAL